jgi:two-component system, cell cycle sensor histidine kinase and response regulator CckA
MDKTMMHNLLRRQLKKSFGDSFVIPMEWQGFIELINDAYREFDMDRNMLERSLELSSHELLQANSEMRAIFEAIPDLFFRLDYNGTIIDCKAGNTSDLYISKERLIGNKIYEIPIKNIANIFRSALEKIKETMSAVNMEYSIALDGEDSYYEARLMPVPGNQIVAIIRNVTERKLAEMALFESEAKYRSIVEESHFGVFIVRNKLFRFVNKRFCEIYGYKYDELVDKLGPKDFVLPEDLPLIKEEMKKIKEAGETARFDFRIRNKSNEIRSIKATGSFITYQGYLSFIGTLLDMSKEKILEEQLLQSQKLETVGRLAGGIAHDFNNMLGVILGNTQLAKLHSSPENKIYEYCSTIEKATSRAADFVKQLLAFSSRQVLELKVVDLEEVLVSFAKMIQRVIGEHIDMNMIISPGLPKIRADITQINQVLLNLVVNARDAMSGGGKLTVETYVAHISQEYTSFYPDLAPGDYIVLSVTDTGSGIPRNIVNKIYEPFFTTKVGGSGLGLSVVYGIVKQHNGFINVYSEPGKGTTFKIYIPSINDAGAEGEDLTERTIEGGRETILIVEDDEDMRKIISEILQSLGYNIIIASDGEEGLDVFTERYDEIDFVILDVVMPKLSGREVYERIKKIKPEVASLFVTGYSLNGSHTDFILKEGIEVLQKPYSFEDIAIKIREILDKRKAP